MKSQADLPLHYGRVPPWLAERMSRLGRGIVEAMVLEYGRDHFLKQLSDANWFQALGCVLGMDWHSSGITTSVMGALKRSLNPISKELGIFICGGRGKHSRQTPSELMQLGYKEGMDARPLIRASKLTAKVDNNALQDGFQIYLHNFIVTREGKWVVVQQGLNNRSGYARRYHWHSESFASFIAQPHAAVVGTNQGLILNLTAPEAGGAQHGIVNISQEHPEKMTKEIGRMILPAHHDVRLEQVNLKRLGSILALAQEKEINGFEELLLLPGLGPRTLQSLTLVSEVIHGTPSRFNDPARFSFAHGGKDGHPFPVPTKVYDQVIDNMDNIVQKAKIQRTEKLQALKSLHEMAASREANFEPSGNLDKLIEHEWEHSNKWGGRTVFDATSKLENKRAKAKKMQKVQQLNLF